MPYPVETFNEAKRLFIEEGHAPARIAELMGGRPVAQTIHNWATTAGRDGRTWYDLREERADQLYEETSPQRMMTKILERIQAILDSPSFDAKQADALAKLQKVFKGVVDSRYHVQMMYQVMSDFILFTKEHHSDVLTARLIEAVRDFKNDLRKRLS